MTNEERLAVEYPIAQVTYDRLILPHLKPEDENKYVCFDIDTGEYEVDDNAVAASDRLEKRRPDGRGWMFRAGWDCTERMGARGPGADGVELNFVLGNGQDEFRLTAYRRANGWRIEMTDEGSLEADSALAADSYDRWVRPMLKAEDEGKYVSFDIDTGDHEADENAVAAMSRLQARRPSARGWLIRAGRDSTIRR